MACVHGQFEVAKVLLAAGANKDAVDDVSRVDARALLAQLECTCASILCIWWLFVKKASSICQLQLDTCEGHKAMARTHMKSPRSHIQ